MRLFTLLKEILLRMNLIADYVVEQGTSGIWKYRKWHSGDAECRGSQTVDATFGASWGSAYLSTNSGATRVYNAALPTGLFNDTPNPRYTVYKAGYLMSAMPASISKSALSYYMHSTANYSGNKVTGIVVYITAKGTWK